MYTKIETEIFGMRVLVDNGHEGCYSEWRIRVTDFDGKLPPLHLETFKPYFAFRWEGVPTYQQIKDLFFDRVLCNYIWYEKRRKDLYLKEGKKYVRI